VKREIIKDKDKKIAAESCFFSLLLPAETLLIIMSKERFTDSGISFISNASRIV
jgi:hypothetical protein